MKLDVAYHGKEELKKSYIDRLEAHRKAEHLMQGVGFEKNGKTKGCNIGCLFDYYDHAKGAEESGIPEALLRLADSLFEKLPVKDANDFAIDWPKAINPGADLSKVRWQFCAFILKENIERVLLLKIDQKLKEQVLNAIQGVLKLHEKATSYSATSAAWSAVRSQARSAAKSSATSAAESCAESARCVARCAAESAEWSDAWSDAWSAAWSAAESAESSARCAAWSAGWYDHWYDAESAAYKRYAKEFVRLLKECK